MPDTERTLGGPAPEEPVELVTEEADREDVSPTEWATGIRRIRRSVIVHDTGHLLAEFDELEYRILAAPEDENVDDLIDRYEILAEQIKGGIRYVAEQRSQDWIDATRERVTKDLGFDAENMTREQRNQVYYARVAPQIVEPEGVTGETLAALFERVPSEAAVLLGLVERANTTITGAVESRDFSSRRSGRKSTKASSGR